MKELLFMEPVFKQMIWGGDRLRQAFSYDIPGDDTGECWAISAHPHGDCRIVNGPYKGMRLSELWREHREVFGNYDCEQFPLLVKIIDAKQDLSIQVHPDDEYARIHEHGSLGKMECWYVLDCDEDAGIVIGHNASGPDELKRMIQEKQWDQLIRKIPVKKGDFFQINPGYIHAIKGGTLILETQQSSDITYRVYDYDRLSEGKPRPLHLRQSMDTIQAPFREEQSQITSAKEPWGVKTHLITCPRYTVEKYDIEDGARIAFEGPFTNVSVIEGQGAAGNIPVKKGSHFIVPWGFGPCDFEGKLSLICSRPE